VIKDHAGEPTEPTPVRYRQPEHGFMAVAWKPGDEHPAVRPYEPDSRLIGPAVRKPWNCCGRAGTDHGYTNHELTDYNRWGTREGSVCVCPGDVVVTRGDGKALAYKPKAFRELFEVRP